MVTPWCPSLLPVSKKVLNPSSRTSLYSFKLEGIARASPLSTHLSNFWWSNNSSLRFEIKSTA